MLKMKPIIVVVIIVVGGLYFLKHTPYARGMMEGGMGSGMMGGTQQTEKSTGEHVKVSGANALSTYINNQNLGCFQCHAVATDSFGPSFASVSVRYASIKNSISILSNHIAHGIGRMPSGLASKTQANQLAKLIIELNDRKAKN